MMFKGVFGGKMPHVTVQGFDMDPDSHLVKHT